MKHWIMVPLVALTLSASAYGATTKTTTVDKPKGTTTKTVTREKGNRTVDVIATRNSDGAIATRNRQRTKTETGVIGEGSSTGFNGKTRSYEYERVKTENGHEVERSISRNGAPVYSRSDSITRSNGHVNRTTNTSRDASFKPRRVRSAGRGRR